MPNLSDEKPGVAARPRLASPLPRRALGLAPYLVLLATSYFVFATSVDDPYITFRYAANLLAGHGPVYNVGERVEGYSSPLHLLASALLLVLAPAADILFKAKLFSLLMAGLALFQMRRLARRVGLSEAEAVGAQTLTALSINFALAATNALETTLYAFLLLSSLLAFLRECRGRGGVASALLLFLALTARPEALLSAAALLVVRAVWARRRGLPPRFVWAWAAVFAGLGAALLCARLLYFGSPFPNTYYAKQIDLTTSLTVGSHYIISPLLFAARKLRWLFNASFWGLILMGAWAVRRSVGGAALIAVAAATCLFVLRAGADWMYGWRFMVPALPVLVLLQCWGARALVHALRRRGAGLRGVAPVYAVLAGLGVWAFASAPHQTWAEAHFSARGAGLILAGDRRGLGSRWVTVADYIRRDEPPGAVIAYSELGYAGYVNMDKTFLDVRGLTDRRVARMPRRFKSLVGIVDAGWYLPGDPLGAILRGRRPDAIISMDYGTPPPTRVMGDYHFVGSLGRASDTTWGAPLMRVYVPLGTGAARREAPSDAAAH